MTENKLASLRSLADNWDEMAVTMRKLYTSQMFPNSIDTQKAEVSATVLEACASHVREVLDR